MLGHGENSQFSIEDRNKAEYLDVVYRTLLVDVQDMQGLHSAFEHWHTEIVYRAAAHKHVPILESNMTVAIESNVRGTCNLVKLCNRYSAQRMTLIPTDKAVRPTSIMGMSKRVAEQVILHAALEHLGRFAAVRFGNVLGSRGSVVPIFQEQMTRFFMSIPEAVLLVLKASILTAQSPPFVLHMGQPVPIVSLADDLTRLSGLEPRLDIEITFTGLRPGERLHEELFWEPEAYQSVEQGSVFALWATPE